MTAFANPWEFDQWNLTLQGQFLKRHGLALAQAYAADAGTSVGSRKPSAPPKPKPDICVLNKKIVTNVGGSGSGSGSSGHGPPTG